MALLRHIISSEGVEADPKKLEAVRNWPRPLSPTDIRSFLGLVGYDRRFVDSFAPIAPSLTTLTQKNVKFEWPEACEKFSQALKDRLTTTLVLTLSEVLRFFFVYCDASRVY